MARLLGIDIPNNKRVLISLTYVFGIGRTLSAKILQDAGVDGNIRVKELTEEQLAKIRNATTKHTLEGDLRRNQAMDIKRLIETGT
ncbi:unnamed protein product [Didymodactylos carnosus]|uniref:Small ribosomal subunit protein uS13 n=1 Tax=Didymodactylos carnosus TaxID=1234261 RepID=A0A8S2GLP9_9BILA|nr:unnamed protein product [Didymodactylos carnosus]CAF3532580.1 unnamed protein product [Didymodactylos carnosus]